MRAPDVELSTINPNGSGRPKGYVAYRPRTKTQLTVDRVLDVYEQMEAADALPVGPRQVGYRLKEAFRGEYPKSSFETIGDIIKRLQQDRRLPWSFVADGSAVTFEASGWRSPDTFLADAHRLYERDRREGQPTVVEVYAEARETLGLIRRLAVERGVTVYSGGGSCGPNLAHKVAARAVTRAVVHGQSTLVAGIADFDLAGIRNVLRPHLENVSAFTYGTAGNEYVIAHEGTVIDQTDAKVSFEQIGLTAVQALDHLDDDLDVEVVRAYVGSGVGLWDRDLTLLDGVQKIETEAMNPVMLRDLVIDAIDNVLDADQLSRIDYEEADQRADLEARITVVRDGGAV